jgi:hypothetical protein
MKYHQKALSMAFLICLLYILAPAYACTVFTKSDGDKVLFGNVENEKSAYVAELHFVPPNTTNGDYGHFYIFYNGNIAGGMNDQGLCFDVAALPPHEMNNVKPYKDLMDYLLKECSTLQDVYYFFSNYSWYGHSVNHLMVTDKTGNSVIVEHVGSGIHYFNKDFDRQVMTNYSLADPDIRYGDYPCPRYEKANEMLYELDVTVDNFQDICEEVSHAYYSALYSTIYDPNSLDIHVFNANLSGSKRTTFNLVDEMNKGAHHYLIKDNEVLIGIADRQAGFFSIAPSFPNPFSMETSFRLDLDREAAVDIRVLNLKGQQMALIEKGNIPPGEHAYFWHAAEAPSGIYICRIRVDGIIETRKWVKRN